MLIALALSDRRRVWAGAGVAILGIAIGVAAWMCRAPHLEYISPDMRVFLSHWYNNLGDHGFAAFRDAFSDYTPAYNYLLYLSAAYLPSLGTVSGVKIVSIAFDFVAAGTMVALLALHFRSLLHPGVWLGAAAVLFWPTVIMNSARWGQCDIIPTAWLLGFIAAGIDRRPALASVLFAIALCFKLQAIFLAPLFLVFLVRGVIPWKHVLTVPAIYTTMVLPAWIAGRPLDDLFLVYVNQTGKYRSLSLYTANFLQWFPGLPDWPTAAIATVGTGVLCLAVVAYVCWRARVLDDGLIVSLAALFAVMAPFFLPRMHERYFFEADVLTIPFAVLHPEFFYVPLLVEFASYQAYLPNLGLPRRYALTHLAWLNLAALVSLLACVVLSVEGRRRAKAREERPA